MRHMAGRQRQVAHNDRHRCVDLNPTHLSVLMEWWYWSEAADTVAIMQVRELPLSPSFSSRVSLELLQGGRQQRERVLELNAAWCAPGPSCSLLWLCSGLQLEAGWQGLTGRERMPRLPCHRPPSCPVR